MKKVIALIRTSTDKQDRESQKKEVIETILADNYKEEQIIVVGDEVGASAIKVDEQYMKNLNTVYTLIETEEVESVYVWAIDRIGRTRTHLNHFREFLVEHGIQLVIKNPSLRLLNEDGSENDGVGTAFALFIELAVQEMKQKKARFAKGKRKNAETGKFNGGIIPFGYNIDKDGFYVINEEQASIVKTTFELMSSDKYSITGLTEELRSRGVVVNGRLINFYTTNYILKNEMYKGFSNKYGYNRIYPRIISDELYNKVQEVLSKNNSSKGKARKHYNFASLLIKCPNCGRSYIAHNGRGYTCASHDAPNVRKNAGFKLCDNSLMIRISHLDGLLWSIATEKHYSYIKGIDDEKKSEIEEQIKVLEQKKIESPKLLEEISVRYERIDEIYSYGRMSKEKYHNKIREIQEDERKITNEIAKYDEEISRLNLLLSSKDNNEVSKWFDRLYVLSELKSEENEKLMYDIVHKYIKKVELERVVLPNNLTNIGEMISNKTHKKFDYKLGGRKAVKIYVYCIDSDIITVYFIPNLQHIENKMIMISKKNEAIPYYYEKIIREDNGYASTESIQLSKAFIEEISNFLREDYNKRTEIYDWLMFKFLPVYGANYTGDFNEVGEEKYRNLKILYNRIYHKHNFHLTISTFNAVCKIFNIDGTEQMILKNFRF